MIYLKYMWCKETIIILCNKLMMELYHPTTNNYNIIAKLALQIITKAGYFHQRNQSQDVGGTKSFKNKIANRKRGVQLNSPQMHGEA